MRRQRVFWATSKGLDAMLINILLPFAGSLIAHRYNGSIISGNRRDREEPAARTLLSVYIGVCANDSGGRGTRLRWRVEACYQSVACIGRGYARREVRVAANRGCALYQRGVHAHRHRQFLFLERGRKAENAARDHPGIREVGGCQGRSHLLA